MHDSFEFIYYYYLKSFYFTEADLNFLMKMALEKVVFMPFAFIMDNWRWSVYNRDTHPDDFNSKWWQLRYYSVTDLMI